MKNRTKFNIIVYFIVLMSFLYGCSNDNDRESTKQNGQFEDISSSFPSFSNNYEAILEEFDDNGVKSYRLYITDINNTDTTKYEADIIFRARDKNYIFWADNEDTLWCYSGDVGTYFWIIKNDSWEKKSYFENKDKIVPQALKEARPNKYN